MENSYKLIEEGRKDELWKKHCGYLKLSRSEFREIQERLLLEQLRFLCKSTFSIRMMGGNAPSTVEEFRNIVPLTTFSEYSDILNDKKDDGLPMEPYVWARTSGQSSDQGPKWIPYTKAMFDHLSDPVIGAMLMSSCSETGVVNLERNDKFLMATAPPPYASGYIARSTRDNLEAIFLPSLEEGEKMSYGERVAAGFKLALEQGLDYFMGISIVLARMGEQFESQTSNSRPSKELFNLAILWRLLRALVISKINNRPILPKDIWKLKGIMSGGTDTEIYKDKIEYYWGKKPLEGFACTEGGNLGMQSWNYKGMTFFPDSVFFEFITLEDYDRNKEDPSYLPKTYLYDELEEGIYELVFSSFYGGVFVRYRIGDFFEVISNDDNEIGTELPQMKFYSRISGIIDLGGLLRLTERNIWKTIEATDIKYNDWVARKEVIDSVTKLHIYIDIKDDENTTNDSVHLTLNQKLSEKFAEYNDFREMIGADPLVVTILPTGSFDSYMKMQIKAGADLAHLKPPHMQPSDAIMETLKTVLYENVI
ncbi:MAG: GH3 auxin-responsive promoter family protein [Anaerolineales bacterium]|nr:GH3 auxin-responsive promoter family protein [Anaerolineales bacterium]